MRTRDCTLTALLIGLGGYFARAADQQPLFPGGRSGQSDKNPFNDSFADFVKQALQEWHVAGLAISVVDGNETFAKGYGFATLPDTPATPETLWYVGSTTKAYTAATLASLIDSGNYSELELGWKTRISSIIRDDFVLQDAWATEHLTLEDAASHRTGMSRHDQSVMWQPENPRRIVKDTVRNLRNLHMPIEPRTEFHYCNLFFTVLGHVAETLTGKWLGDVMKDIIWGPLGMNSTYFDLGDALDAQQQVSQGYIWHEDKEELKPLPYVQNAVMNGAGAIISNVLDYAKWVKCLLNQDLPFSETVHKEIRRPRVVSAFHTPGSDITSYSLAWFQATVHGRTVYWHSGSTMTHAAMVYWFPNDNYGVTIFVNSVSPIVNVLLYRLLEDKFQIPAEERINVAEMARKEEEHRRQMRANATNILFPDRPADPLPSTLKLEDHVGTYESAGYGQVTFYVGTHPSQPEETTLVAERLDRAWNETLRLDHVSGDFWIWNSYIAEGPNVQDTSFRTEFKLGPDATIDAVEIENYDFAEGFSQGFITFKKVV